MRKTVQVRYYSMWDKVAKEFSALEAVKNDDVAWRKFTMTLSQPNTRADDFQLWYILTVDSETGEITDDVAVEVFINFDMEDENASNIS